MALRDNPFNLFETAFQSLQILEPVAKSSEEQKAWSFLARLLAELTQSSSFEGGPPTSEMAQRFLVNRRAFIKVGPQPPPA